MWLSHLAAHYNKKTTKVSEKNINIGDYYERKIYSPIG